MKTTTSGGPQRKKRLLSVSSMRHAPSTINDDSTEPKRQNKCRSPSATFNRIDRGNFHHFGVRLFLEKKMFHQLNCNFRRKSPSPHSMAIEKEMTPPSVIVSAIGPIPSPSSASLPHQGPSAGEGEIKRIQQSAFSFLK